MWVILQLDIKEFKIFVSFFLWSYEMQIILKQIHITNRPL